MPNRIKRWFFDQMAAWCVLFRRRDLALEYYGKMLELDPGDPLALASIAFQTAQQGRKREALAAFDRLLAVQPEDAEAHFNRGFLLQEMNDHEGAMAAFRRAIALNPDHDRAHYGLALSLISDAAPGGGAGAAEEEHEAAADEPVRLVSAGAGPARARPDRRDADRCSTTWRGSSPRSRGSWNGRPGCAPVRCHDLRRPGAVPGIERGAGGLPQTAGLPGLLRFGKAGYTPGNSTRPGPGAPAQEQASHAVRIQGIHVHPGLIVRRSLPCS